jgi:Uncharacterised protein family UPF0547
MESSVTTKACPDCAEDVKAAARLCRFCGYRWDEVDAAVAVAVPAEPPRVGRNAELKGFYLNGEKWERDRWLVLMDDGLAISGDKEASFAARWDGVEAINVDGPDSIQSRVTVPRVLLLGLFALAAKKNESRTYVTVETVEHRVVVFGMETPTPDVRVAIAPFVPVLAHHRATRV